MNDFQITSPAFMQGQNIPEQYTCKGDNINPPLNIINVPPEANSLVLILHDPDAVSGDFAHWLMWDIQPATQSINANSVPVGAIQGPNSAGSNTYTGPCPPDGTGTHRYMFELYALDTTLSFDSDSTREKVEAAMKGHILAQTLLTGLVSAN